MAAVSHLAGVVVAFMLLAWIGLLFVPFRWRRSVLTSSSPKVAAGAFSHSSPPPACCLPSRDRFAAHG